MNNQGKLQLGLVRRCAGAMLMLFCSSVFAALDDKIALVIGNGAYEQAPLKNPTNDANAIARSLKRLGFAVIQRENAEQSDMLDALREFSRRSVNSKVRLVFYAGHGVQLKGRNYLMPVDVNVKAEEDVKSQGVDISEFLERLSVVKSGVNLVILDACRNNPFVFAPNQLAGVRGSVRTRGLNSSGDSPVATGLAQIQAPTGTIVAFSTSPGSVSIDGVNQGQGVYTKHLLDQLGKSPNLPVEQLFKQVRTAVVKETNSQQVPWESSSLLGDFCFKPDAQGKCGG